MIKRNGYENWEPAKYVSPSRLFSLQCPGDYSPQDVLDAAVDKGFKL
jgi:hypothetical protein